MDNYSKFYKYILLTVIIIFIIVLGAYYSNFDKKEVDTSIKKEDKIIKKQDKNVSGEENTFYVDIKGAVNNPGVYEVKKYSRVIDVINMAGGLKENADTSIINLSKRLTDEMCVIIYTVEELKKYKDKMLTVNEIKEELENDSIKTDNFNDANINNIDSDNTGNEIVYINQATKEELMTISGIGESKANSIIKYREENGPFEKIEDIMNVSGIGKSLYEKIKEFIAI